MLTKKSSDPFLGFEDRSVKRGDQQTIVGVDEFYELAKRVIDVYYG